MIKERPQIINRISLTSLMVLLLFIITGCGGGKQSDSTVVIGEQEWMKSNLNVTLFRNGDTIPHAGSDEEWRSAGELGQPAWCYYNNDPSNDKEHGKLYNWYAVNDWRGLAPEGWSIPSYSDLMILGEHLGGVKEAGKKMKVKELWGRMAGGTNESGFSGKAGGSRDYEGVFSTSATGYWWTSDELSGFPKSAWHFSLSPGNDALYSSPLDKRYGFSVRCLKLQP